MKRLSRLLHYISEHKGQVALYFLTNVLGTLFGVLSFGMLSPVLSVLFKVTAEDMTKKSGLIGAFYRAIDTVIREQGTLNALTYLCIVVVTFTVLKNTFLYLSLYILNPIRNSILAKLRRDLFDKTLSLPIGFFTEERKGDLVSRMTNDINEIELSIMGVLEVFIREPVTIIFYLTSMITISPHLTLFLLLVLPPAGLIIGLISKSLRKSNNIAMEQLGLLLATIDETLSGMRVIKAFSAEKTVQSRFATINNKLLKTRNRIAARREMASPMSETLGVIVVCGILWYGGRLIITNQSVLSGVTFVTYIALFTQIISPFKNISSAFYNVQKGSAALDRVEYLLTVENTIKELPDAQPVTQFNHQIELRNVGFSYGDKQILTSLNMTVEKGKIVALVGASGAGKSTLVDLIPRFHDVTEGEILLDGVNIKNYRISDLRSLMGVVGQDPILFNDTIESNITMGTTASEAEVQEAARIAHADKFIIQKPEGYQTVAGDRGARLSGGERQRVTIARAVLKNPPIMILDEATSSLDTESERIVQEAINTLMTNRTCIVIAHRLSTVKHADEIIVLDKGRIAERGTHQQLLENNGIYRKLVEMQQVK